MKSIPRISSCFAFAAILAAFLFALPAATAADSLGDHVGMISVPAGLSSSDVQGAIVTVLSVRQWGIKEKGDDRVVGYLKHRSNEATLTLVFDTTKIDLYCVGYKIDKKTGVREKPELPTGWIKKIQGDLTKAFNKTITQK